MVEPRKKESQVLHSAENDKLSKGYTLIEPFIVALILGIVTTSAIAAGEAIV